MERCRKGRSKGKPPTESVGTAPCSAGSRIAEVGNPPRRCARGTRRSWCRSVVRRIIGQGAGGLRLRLRLRPRAAGLRRLHRLRLICRRRRRRRSRFIRAGNALRGTAPFSIRSPPTRAGKRPVMAPADPLPHSPSRLRRPEAAAVPGTGDASSRGNSVPPAARWIGRSGSASVLDKQDSPPVVCYTQRCDLIVGTAQQSLFKPAGAMDFGPIPSML
jgi:hypothetical protein